MCAWRLSDRTHILAGKQPAPERGGGDDRGAELARGPEQINLRVLNDEREWRVLDLERRDWMHSLRTPQRRGGCLGQAKICHFASAGEALRR
jgi:hypothetical protein